MYLIGHAILTRDAKMFSEEEIFDGRLATLMLPDFVNCHDWAYSAAWKVRGEGMRLIQAHMLADWYVHFGDRHQTERVRRGWAYLKMRPATKRYWTFFSDAYRLGLRSTPTPNDSVRGFAHTQIEYLVDFHMARQGLFDRYFDRAKSELEYLDDGQWLMSQISDLSIEGSDPNFLGVANRYKARAAMATAPEDIALLGLCSKFDLKLNQSSLEYVGNFQSLIYQEVGADEVESLIRKTTQALADPTTFRWADKLDVLSIEPSDQPHF